MERAEETLLKLIKNKEFQVDKWHKKPFEKFKIISTTEKGNIAEDFFINLLEKCNKKVSRPQNRKGDYDILVDNNVKIEVKLATEDKSGSFQFNGIRHDTKYTHLFCLGVSPDTIYYIIIVKKDLNEDYTLVSMAKGSNSSFKLTLTKKNLKLFKDFEQDIEKI